MMMVKYSYSAIPEEVRKQIASDYSDGIPMKALHKKYELQTKQIQALMRVIGVSRPKKHVEKTYEAPLEKPNEELLNGNSAAAIEHLKACSNKFAPTNEWRGKALNAKIMVDIVQGAIPTMTHAEMHRARLAEIDGAKGISLPRLRIQQSNGGAL
jgi:hypothetical protein